MADEKLNENTTLRRQLVDQRAELTKVSKISEVQKDDIDRLKKEIERMKMLVRNRSEDLDRVKKELPILKAANVKFAARNEELIVENEMLRRDLERLKVIKTLH